MSAGADYGLSSRQDVADIANVFKPRYKIIGASRSPTADVGLLQTPSKGPLSRPFTSPLRTPGSLSSYSSPFSPSLLETPETPMPWSIPGMSAYKQELQKRKEMALMRSIERAKEARELRRRQMNDGDGRLSPDTSHKMAGNGQNLGAPKPLKTPKTSKDAPESPVKKQTSVIAKMQASRKRHPASPEEIQNERRHQEERIEELMRKLKHSDLEKEELEKRLADSDRTISKVTRQIHGLTVRYAILELRTQLEKEKPDAEYLDDEDEVQTPEKQDNAIQSIDSYQRIQQLETLQRQLKDDILKLR